MSAFVPPANFREAANVDRWCASRPCSPDEARSTSAGQSSILCSSVTHPHRFGAFRKIPRLGREVALRASLESTEPYSSRMRFTLNLSASTTTSGLKNQCLPTFSRPISVSAAPPSGAGRVPDFCLSPSVAAATLCGAERQKPRNAPESREVARGRKSSCLVSVSAQGDFQL
jgi:hypothetical protein